MIKENNFEKQLLLVVHKSIVPLDDLFRSYSFAWAYIKFWQINVVNTARFRSNSDTTIVGTYTNLSDAIRSEINVWVYQFKFKI